MRGLKWSSMNQFIGQGALIVTSIILARLLDPRAFGLVGMITVFTGFLNVFKDFGLGSSLIYSTEVSKKDIDTVFWSNVILSVFLFLVVVALSQPIAAFYEEEQLVALTLFIGLNFLLQGFFLIQYSLLRRAMDFKRKFIIDTSSIAIAATVAIAMALNGFGVWALAFQTFVLNLSKAVMLWVTSSWKPSFFFSYRILKEHLSYGAPILGTHVAKYFMANTDNFLIGKMLGASALGIYSRSYSLMVLPVTNISGVLVGVFFPALSKIKEDLDKVREVYLLMNSFIAFVSFPLMGLLFVFTEEVVYLLLGPQWMETVPIIKIFSVMGAIQSVSYVGLLYNSLGKTTLYFKINLITNSLIIVGIVVGLQYGVIGVAVGYCAANICVVVLQWIIAGSLINLSFWNYVKAILDSALVTVGVCAVMLFVKDNYLQIDNLLVLIAWCVVYGLFYLAVGYVFKTPSFVFVLERARALLKK